MKRTSLGQIMKELTPRNFTIEGKETYAYDKAIVFNERDVGAKGAKYQVVSFPPGASVPAHFHKKVREVFLIATGIGTVTVNDKENFVKKGDIFLIEPGDTHALKNTGMQSFVIHIFKWNEDADDITWA